MNTNYLFLLLMPFAINAMDKFSETINSLKLNKTSKNRLTILTNHINSICHEKNENSDELLQNNTNELDNKINFKETISSWISQSSKNHAHASWIWELYENTGLELNDAESWNNFFWKEKNAGKNVKPYTVNGKTFLWRIKKDLSATQLFKLVKAMTLNDILAIDPETWVTFLEEYSDLVDEKYYGDRDPLNLLLTALAQNIKISELSAKTIASLHPFILRAVILLAHKESRQSDLEYLVTCVTTANISQCDDEALELLYKAVPSFKKQFIKLIEKCGISNVPHFMVHHMYTAHEEGKEWVLEKIQDSVKIFKDEKKELLDIFLFDPMKALRLIKNIKLLDNYQEVFKSMKISQSSQHFSECITMVGEEMGYRLQYSTELRIQLIQALKKASEEEEKGNIVFFHAQKQYWGFLQDIFKQLWNMYFSDKKPVGDDYWFFRYNLPGMNLPFEKLLEVIEIGRMMSIWPFETLYMNYALFGSTWGRGSSSAKYVQNNHDYCPIKLTIRELFEAFGWENYYDTHASEFEELEKLFLKSSGKYGTIIVLSFSKDSVNEYVCSSQSGGQRAPKIINGIATDDVLKIITTLKEKPDTIQDADKVEFFAPLTDGKKDDLLDENGKGILNPYNKNIRMHAIRSGNLQNYFERLTTITEKIRSQIKNDQELNNSKKVLLHEQEQSSILKILEKGLSRSKGAKYQIYCQDCIKFNNYNALIKKHNNSNTLRVMSYNVHYWVEGEQQFGLYTSNIERILDSIQQLNPDVVCLQEVSLKPGYFNSYDGKALTKKFRDMGYGYGGEETFGCGITKWDIFGNITFSKYPIENIFKKEYVLPNESHDERRTFVGTTVLYNDQKIRVYNTHLDVWDQSGTTRQHEVQELLKHIETEDSDVDSVMIVGDFNETRSRDYQYTIGNTLAWDIIKKDNQERGETTNCYVEQEFEKAGYKDAYELRKKWPVFTSAMGKIIDFCYVRPNGTAYVDDVNVLYDKMSDHTPIIIDLKFSTKENSNNQSNSRDKKILQEISQTLTENDRLEDQTSSILRIAQTGQQQTAYDKQQRYIQDCLRYKIFNNALQKHNPKTTVRVMTWNVNDWSKPDGTSNFNEVFDVIKHINPDIVCLHNMYFGKTENNQWIPFFDATALGNGTDELSKKFQSLDFGGKKDKNKERHGGPQTFGYNKALETNSGKVPCGSILFSKYTLKNMKTAKFKMPDNSQQRYAFVSASILFNKKPLFIITTHLDPDNNNNRAQEMLELMNHLYKTKEENIFVCGDFGEAYKPNYSSSEWEVIKKENKREHKETTTHVTDGFEKAGYKNALELSATKKLPFTHQNGLVTDLGFVKEPKNNTVTIEHVYPYFTSISKNIPVVFDLGFKN